MKLRFSIFLLVVILAGCGKKALESTESAPPPGESQAASAAKPPAMPSAAPPELALAKPPAVLPSGTTIKVRTMAALSTKTAGAGEAFSATLAEPLVANGEVVAARGTRVQGIVSESNPGGRVKGRAHLSVRLTSIEIGGESLPLSTGAYTRTAGATKKRDAAKIGIGSGIGAAIGAIAAGGKGAALGAAAGAGAGTGVVLGTRGKPAVIPSESVLTFRLRTPLTVSGPRSQG